MSWGDFGMPLIWNDQVAEVVRLYDELKRLEPEFAKALPATIPAGQLVRDVLTELRREPDLHSPEVDPQSVLGAPPSS